MALMIARAMAWKGVGTEGAEKLVWKRVAYATRYGKAGLLEALELDQYALQGFLEAVSDIVQEENAASRR